MWMPWRVGRGLGAQLLQTHHGLLQTWTGKHGASQEFETNQFASHWSPPASASFCSFLHSAKSLPLRTIFQSQDIC